MGSGKTVVAFLAALHALEAGHQVAFMAPTEILARQHGATLAALAAPVGAAVAVLTGATPAAARRALAARLEAGEPLLVVGTHALLEEKVRLPDLALAIVDEQHRFGVRQRATLARKGVIPDVLVLTATPIPRTLMLACYGDLAVSTLQGAPRRARAARDPRDRGGEVPAGGRVHGARAGRRPPGLRRGPAHRGGRPRRRARRRGRVRAAREPAAAPRPGRPGSCTAGSRPTPGSP